MKLEEYIYYAGIGVLTALLAVWLIVVTSRFAAAHDVFQQERMLNRQTLQPTGPSCCGGHPDTGDCEHLAPDQIQVRPDGGMRIYSKRYSAYVEVSPNQVQTKRITGAPAWAAGAWCGVRTPWGTELDPFQADRQFLTYCAHLSPRDV